MIVPIIYLQIKINMPKHTSSRPCDAVDAIVTQWQRERPDLDLTPMGPIGRLNRCAALLQFRLDKTFAEFGMSFWEFDVLATLRRNGPPYLMTPTALFSTLMVTSGTMTHRLKRLETSGWVQRLPNHQDARSLLVQLTPQGKGLIDRAIEAHLDNERNILSAIAPETLAQLDAQLSTLLIALESNELTQPRVHS